MRAEQQDAEGAGPHGNWEQSAKQKQIRARPIEIVIKMV